MALIYCRECGKEISDKAATCPGCGCPVTINVTEPVYETKHYYEATTMYQDAYKLHYKKPKNLSIAKEIYEKLIDIFPGSTEATYSRQQLDNIKSSHPVLFNDNDSYNMIDNDSINVSRHVEVVKPTTDSQNNDFVAGTNPNYIDIPEIPVGLYMITAILGFPLGTGIALGGYFGAKRLIDKGDYDKARKQIKSTKSICWLILVLCATAIIVTIAMCLSV